MPVTLVNILPMWFSVILTIIFPHLMAVGIVIIPNWSRLSASSLAEKSRDPQVNKRDNVPAPESVLSNGSEKRRWTVIPGEEEKGAEEDVGCKSVLLG